MVKRILPKILAKQTVAQSSFFSIESLNLLFSNGEKRTYERIKPSNRNAVMTVPITEQGDLLLVREYAAGTERYELGFPKGLIDFGESPQEAAMRELKEEIGFGANTLIPLKEVILAPSYFSSRMTLFIAKNLYTEKLKGDEPEPLEIVRWPQTQTEELLAHLDFCEARSITALMLSFRYFEKNDN
ncbi:ADP compounds hydrolase nudE [Candidatus Photodesmus blepharus]|uniref:ADP compounds hydrolase nudE n=1 Tax=Candidatus Photodesmus blepharonis TaxID=1179155 RepID=A0A084CNK7_9GAMM|nr:ADP compounds hydrolase NudE [Candidatus Photodesmus blepharus]KEY91386.1 ADP compounds hydrolase nudE [Candidatus Photodesmus blepharus]